MLTLITLSERAPIPPPPAVVAVVPSGPSADLPSQAKASMVATNARIVSADHRIASMSATAFYFKATCSEGYARDQPQPPGPSHKKYVVPFRRRTHSPCIWLSARRRAQIGRAHV